MIRLALLVLILLLSGCAEVSEYVTGEESTEPAELVEFKPTLTVDMVWSAQLNPVPLVQDYRLYPIEVEGIVYVAEPEGRIAAYKATNGKLVWETLTKTTISGGLGSGNGFIFAGTAHGEVLALDRLNGKIIWRATVSSEVLSAPQAGNNIVVTHVSDGKVVALNAADGKRLWVNSYTVPSLSLRGTSSPMLWNDKVIVGLSNGKLVALDLFNGKALWETTIAVPRGRSELERMVDIDAAIQVWENIGYVVSYQGRIAAVDLNNGQILWARDMSSYRDIAVDKTQLYVTDVHSQVWALDRSSGATLWRQDKLKNRSLTAPVVQQDYVVVGDFKGFLHWLGREDGRMVARVDLEGAYNRAAQEGTVQDIDEEDQPNDFKVNVGINAAPIVNGNRIFVTDKRGVLAAYQINK